MSTDLEVDVDDRWPCTVVHEEPLITTWTGRRATWTKQLRKLMIPTQLRVSYDWVCWPSPSWFLTFVKFSRMEPWHLEIHSDSFLVSFRNQTSLHNGSGVLFRLYCSDLSKLTNSEPTQLQCVSRELEYSPDRRDWGCKLTKETRGHGQLM